MTIHQGMTRISTAGQWVQATSATVPVRSRDMIFFEWPLWSRSLNVRYFRLAGNGLIVRSKPAIRRTVNNPPHRVHDRVVSNASVNE
jgi:hypothetical protein